jgi:Putative peptidoglycan binding domain/L,D-transpeptidase catalytic domain
VNARWILLPTSLALALAAPAAARADTVDLALGKPAAQHGKTIRATGTVQPPSAQPVTLELQRDDGTSVLATGTSAPDGTYRLSFKARLPGRIVARTPAALSAPVGFGVRPVLRLRVGGRRYPTGALKVSGRVLPAAAGQVRLGFPGGSKTVTPNAKGRFKTGLRARRPGRLCVRAGTAAASGLARGRERTCVTIASPSLSIGSRGPAVRLLERRLRALRYVLRGANGYFGDDTRDALMAYQKVEGIARTGTATDAAWRHLASARPYDPSAGGDYIEISKSKQLLVEVRDGKARRVIHTSTGVTGNTPVGRWRVYRKDPGFNAIGMYYSLYFLRGFAIHGYVSVPPFPASHGCARLPLWLAKSVYDNWGLGTVVRVLP